MRIIIVMTRMIMINNANFPAIPLEEKGLQPAHCGEQ